MVLILIPIVLLVLVGLMLGVRYRHRRGYYRGDITLAEDERRWAEYYRKDGE